MLTLRAVLKDGKIYFPDEPPPGGEQKVLVTILDEEAGNDVISENRLNWLRVCVIDEKALLNDRQTKILALASKGLKSREIGEELGMTFGAVRTQFYKIYRILNVRLWVQLASGTASPESRLMPSLVGAGFVLWID